ncbi:hypothetical protein JHW43_007053 [Diplocarpon mali]|nr:hypothetical protein JHW43_007053 [Diplocarpon mali]
MLTIPLQINGLDVTTPQTLPISSPATGRVLHHASCAGPAEATLAVEAAAAAFPAWAAVPPDDKRAIFLKAADELERRRDEAGQAEEEETGARPAFAGGFDVPLAVSALRDVAGKIATVQGSIPTMGDPARSALVVKEPFGVVLGIAPWNAPFVLGFRAVSYAIAAGNTAVLKVSEAAPKTMGLIGHIFRSAGLPPGVLNILQHHPADAAAVTRTLIEHPAVRKVNFTGSTAVGRIVAELAGRALKPVLLELGGKAPALVLRDADLPAAAAACAVGAFLHAGQICMATERIIVEASIRAAFVAELTAAIDALFPRAGEALVLASEAGVRRNRALVADAAARGGEVIFGRGPGDGDDDDDDKASPARMRPVVVQGVTREMDLYYQESFGPTVSLLEAADEDEAVALANDTEYGLSAAVFTADLARGLRVARRIESGAVHINAMSVHDEPALPHGGVKSSGWGRFGSAGIEEWVKTKTITFVN